MGKTHNSAIIAVVIMGVSACGPEFLEQDTDGDGLVNSSDWCPTVAEEPNGFEDEDGCPDEVPLESAPPIDLRIAGLWGGGTITITPAGRPVFQNGTSGLFRAGVQLQIAPRLHDAVARFPCGGTGETEGVIVTGSGRLLQLDVGVACPSQGEPACPWFITYEHAVILLGEDKTLTMSATGKYSDCNGVVPMTVEFLAPRHH